MTSLFELFKIGVGPSSSHTVGPMRAALSFVHGLQKLEAIERVERLQIDLYGSLALTGIGHATDRACILGLSGCAPDTLTAEQGDAALAAAANGSLQLGSVRSVPFRRESDLLFHRDQMYPDPDHVTHPNGMCFSAFDNAGAIVAVETYFSIGGGFIVTAEHFAQSAPATPQSSRTVPFPFRSAAEMLQLAAENKLTIAEMVFRNELAMLGDPAILRPRTSDPNAAGEDIVREGILALAQAMSESVDRGIATEGILPGGLNVRRRAHRLAARLKENGSTDPLAPLDWLTVFAMAVNEENASGGRVVTAPTNGAAGVIPAIARYYLEFLPGANEEGLLRYFLTAAAMLHATPTSPWQPTSAPEIEAFSL